MIETKLMHISKLSYAYESIHYAIALCQQYSNHKHIVFLVMENDQHIPDSEFIDQAKIYVVHKWFHDCRSDILEQYKGKLKFLFGRSFMELIYQMHDFLPDSYIFNILKDLSSSS
jgi:hypothetical protein